MRTAKTLGEYPGWLISLGGCPGWSESSLGAQVIFVMPPTSKINCFNEPVKSELKVNSEQTNPSKLLGANPDQHLFLNKSIV